MSDKKIKFIKAHGLGNDLVIFDGADRSLIGKNVTFIADRKYGIGCDQVACINGRKVIFWNQDGSVAKFCGNGCRCVIKYMLENNPLRSIDPLKAIETDAGIVSGSAKGDLVVIEYPAHRKLVNEGDYYSVDIGNQHVIIFSDHVNSDGNSLNSDSYLNKFHNQTVNIMRLTKKIDSWFMEIYEAGVGETNACGSGAMAATLAIWDREGHKNPVRIYMKGGSLLMKWENNTMYQEGLAEIVFNGEIGLLE